MTLSYASAVIPASADRVWSIVRDFNGLPETHPGIASSTIEGGAAPAEVGCVRALTLADGGQVRERLVALDDRDRSYTYEILTSPFPIRSYVATIRVRPVTSGDESFVEWYAHFDADAADEAKLDETFSSGVFATGLGGLRDIVAG